MVLNQDELLRVMLRLQMQPVLPAKSEADGGLQLFLTEAVAASGQTTTSTNSAPSSTTSTVAAEESSTLTIVIRFNLTEGRMNFVDHTDLVGDTRFMGAMHFQPNSVLAQEQLSLLLTETLDDSSDESLRSAWYLYKTSKFAHVRAVLCSHADSSCVADRALLSETGTAVFAQT